MVAANLVLEFSVVRVDGYQATSIFKQKCKHDAIKSREICVGSQSRKRKCKHDHHQSLAEYISDVAHTLSFATLYFMLCVVGHLILDLKIQFFVWLLLQSTLFQYEIHLTLFTKCTGPHV
jgi:hypothetical protein